MSVPPTTMDALAPRTVPPAKPAARARSPWLHPLAKPAVFIACLLPLAWLVVGGLTEHLGSNPAETLIRSTGDWTLRMLCLTLAITPLRQWAGLTALARFRRMLGLFTFFYGALHFTAYAGLDMGLVWADIAHDVAKRPFILVGVSALTLMLPLALTSFNRAIKALGAARWQMLHRLVYAVAALGMLHFFWMRAAKHRYGEVAIYGAVLVVLMGARLLRSSKKWTTRTL